MDGCFKIILRGILIVSGGANGADSLAERYSKENDVEIRVFCADWAKYGRAAGPKRNREMSRVGGVLLVFWDGESRGTANMIEESKYRNIPTHIVYF